MENMEYNKKVFKSIVYNVNLMSQITNEIWPPQILQSYHKLLVLPFWKGFQKKRYTV